MIKENILGLIRDLVSDLLYYDRKEYEEYPVGFIEGAIENNYITIEDMIQEFKTQLYENISIN